MKRSSIPPKVRPEISGETWLSRVGARDETKPRGNAGLGQRRFEFPKRRASPLPDEIPEWQVRIREGYYYELGYIQRRLHLGQLPRGQFMNDGTNDRMLRSQLWWRSYMRERRRS